MKKFGIFLYIVLFLLLCGPKQDKVERIIEDGIEVVVNHLEPYQIKGEPTTLTLEEEFVINMESEKIAEIGMSHISMFGVDSLGDIYCMSSKDEKGNLFYKFDNHGNFIHSFGREGQGPGELQIPMFIRLNKQDEIVILDNRKKLTIFNAKGNLIREISIDSNHQIATLLENGNILAMRSLIKPDDGIIELPIVLCNSDLEEIKVLVPGQKIANFSRANKINGLDMSPDFFVWSISNGHICVGNLEKGYEFSMYDIVGKLLRKIRKEYNPVKVPQELKEQMLKRFERPALESIRKKIYFPDFFPPFQYYFMDDKGRLFVMTYEKGNNPREFLYDIFNPEGIFIGRTKLSNYGNFLLTQRKSPFYVVAKTIDSIV
jgi:hypothetical protein